MNKKLYRDEYHKVLGGVCSGLAEYFEMDVTVVRLLFAFTFFIMGAGFIPYIILWIVLPKKGYPYYNPTVDYTVPPQQPADQPFTQNTRQYGNNPFSDNTFGRAPFNNNPDGTALPKQKSNAGIIFGFVLIVVGASILADNFDLIPDFDFDRLWPVILVLVGAALIVSGQKKQPWEKQNWHNAGHVVEEPSTESPAADNNTTV